ncbi:hypothetical protein ACLOJK_037264 [Asimina triloba]
MVAKFQIQQAAIKGASTFSIFFNGQHSNQTWAAADFSSRQQAFQKIPRRGREHLPAIKQHFSDGAAMSPPPFIWASTNAAAISFFLDSKVRSFNITWQPATPSKKR